MMEVKGLVVFMLLTKAGLTQGVDYPITHIENGIKVVTFTQEQIDFIWEKDVRYSACDSTSSITEQQLKDCKLDIETRNDVIRIQQEIISRHDTIIFNKESQFRLKDKAISNLNLVHDNDARTINGLNAKVAGLKIGAYGLGGAFAIMVVRALLFHK